MSGPKYSRFELEQMRARELERQRQQRLEEERRRREKEKQTAQSIEKQKSKLLQLKDKIVNEKKRLLNETDQMGLSNTFVSAKLEEQFSQIITKIDRILIKKIPTELEQMEQFLNELNEFFTNIKIEVEKIVQSVEEDLIEEESRVKEQEEIESILKQTSELVAEQKRSYSIPKRKKVEDKKENINIDQLYSEVREQLEPYLTFTSSGFYREIDSIYRSIHDIYHSDFDDKYKKHQIENRISTFFAKKKSYDEQLNKIVQEREEYEQLLIEYQSLCSILKKEENETFQHPADVQLSQLKEKLKLEIQQLTTEYKEQEEMKYIVESVNEVMESLGYDILATDYMIRKSQNLHHHMYEFGEQAVNVFVSDKGSVLFEVSGVSEGTKEMTSLERLKVKEAMEAFCEDYDLIKDRLKEKGIHLTNESLNPPGEQYARTMDISNKRIVKKDWNRRSSKTRTNQTDKRYLNH